MCKDFLTDVIWATINKKNIEIYGFSYDLKNNPPISLDPVMLIVRNKQLENYVFDKQITNCVKFLNLIEIRLKFELCKAEKVKYKGNGSVWLFTFDKRWIHASPMISMLSLMMRIGCHYKGTGSLINALKKFKQGTKEIRESGGTSDDYFDDIDENKSPIFNDAQYLKQSFAMRNLILKRSISIFKEKIEENYPSNVDTHSVHNCWGIVAAQKQETFKTIWDLSGLEVLKTKKVSKE